MRRSRLWASTCSGVFVTGPCTSSLIRPSSVSLPVPTTTPRPRPEVTRVPLKVMLVRSVIAVCTGRRCTCLVTGSTSPVSIDSSTCRALTASRRRSAGTRSPESRTTTSPGTSSAAGISWSSPSRITRHRGTVRLCNARTADSARRSCQNPMPALSASTTKIATASAQCCCTAVITKVSTRMPISGLTNCRPSTFHAGVASVAGSSLRPWTSIRRRASAEVSPSIDVASSPSTSVRERTCHVPPARSRVASGGRTSVVAGSTKPIVPRRGELAQGP